MGTRATHYLAAEALEHDYVFGPAGKGGKDDTLLVRAQIHATLAAAPDSVATEVDAEHLTTHSVSLYALATTTEKTCERVVELTDGRWEGDPDLDALVIELCLASKSLGLLARRIRIHTEPKP